MFSFNLFMYSYFVCVGVCVCVLSVSRVCHVCVTRVSRVCVCFMRWCHVCVCVMYGASRIRASRSTKKNDKFCPEFPRPERFVSKKTASFLPS